MSILMTAACGANGCFRGYHIQRETYISYVKDGQCSTENFIERLIKLWKPLQNSSQKRPTNLIISNFVSKELKGSPTLRS